jgi:predicted NBD/HSP70 family sugar kinase
MAAGTPLPRGGSGAGHVVGIEVGETGIRTGLFDRELRALAMADAPLPEIPAPSDVVAGVEDAVRAVFTATSLPMELVLGAGVGVPGSVDRTNGESVVHAPTIGWHGVPLAALLRRRIGLPVQVGNGARAMGRAELRLGAGRGARTAALTLFGTGVGACLVSQGVVYDGATNSAGEWGHMAVSMDGRRCRCGSSGCLEAYVGAGAIADRYIERSPESVGLSVRTLVTDVLAGARQDEPARSVAMEVIEYAGIGIANLAQLLQPDHIVLGGWVGLLMGRHRLHELSDVVARRTPRTGQGRTRITMAKLGAEGVAVGAAMLALDALSSPATPRPAVTAVPHAETSW